MNARYYLPYINRFISADTIVPDPANPQSFNRYSYGLNNPVKYSDPTGHVVCQGIVTDCSSDGNWSLPHGIPPSHQLLFIYRKMILLAVSEEVDQLKELNNTCYNCVAPTEAEVQMASAMADTTVRIEALIRFVCRVCTNCSWDPKEWLRYEFGAENLDTYVHSIAAGGENYYYDIWGNIVFGYIGKASGFSDDALLDGAGLEQFGDDVVGRNRSPHAQEGIMGVRRWDDPRDQAAIQIGTDLWSSYDLAVSSRDLYDAINEAVDFATVKFKKESKAGVPEEVGQIVWRYRTPSLAAQHFSSALQLPANAVPGTKLGLQYSSLKADTFRIYCLNKTGGSFGCTAQARHGSYVYSMSSVVHRDNELTPDVFLYLVRSIESKMAEVP